MTGGGTTQQQWADRADEAQRVLRARFRARVLRPGRPALYRTADPARRDRPRERWEGGWHLMYWWQAHALDAMVDAYLRRPTALAALRMAVLPLGVRLANKARIVNAFYDDMGWMALAAQRAADAGAPTRGTADRLWRELQGGWNDHHGGGIAWSRMQPDYKNVPANGPAAILAARRYARTGDQDDLDWAQRITTWLDDHLVDPQTGLVWDGIGRQGDDRVDREWVFSYTHGLYLGAHTELFAVTGDARHAEAARRTAAVVVRELAPDGVLRDEGSGDGALFRGILARYLVDYLTRDGLAAPGDPARDVLVRSAEAAWAARDAAGRFGPSWSGTPDGPVPLSAQLSGVLLMEAVARLTAHPLS